MKLVPHDKKFKEQLLSNSKVRIEYEQLKPEFELLKKIVEARQQAGMTQEEVAEKMGTKKTAISRMEAITSNHSPSLSTLYKYAKAVNCQLEINFIPNN